MDIAYATRSQFLATCEAAIRQQQVELDAGGTVCVDLGEGGYDGRVVVTIRSDNPSSFDAAWTNPDPTRFPARIKAAATALLNSGYEGAYELTHENGILTIRRA